MTGTDWEIPLRVAVTVEFPAETPLRRPVLLMVATAGADEAHATLELMLAVLPSV